MGNRTSGLGGVNLLSTSEYIDGFLIYGKVDISETEYEFNSNTIIRRHFSNDDGHDEPFGEGLFCNVLNFKL